jgi:tripartite-type tricarboxylate transporter receptor subunit TctC
MESEQRMTKKVISVLGKLWCAVAVAMAVAAPALSQPAGTGDWPSKTISIVVGYPPGSGIEVVARFLAEHLRERLGQPVIVENKAGALGNIAANAVVRAAPDGYTILYTANNTHAANIHLFKDLGFDPVRDFTPVTTVVTHAFMLTVNANSEAKTVAELTAYIKARAGKLAYGTGSATSLVAAELYRSMAKLDALNVPYKGMPPLYTDLFAGRVDYAFTDVPVGLNFVRAGKIRSLAVTSAKRAAAAPEIPTMAESGFPGFDLNAWQAMFLPANTPKPIAERLAQLSNEAMRTEKARQFMSKLHLEPMPGSPDQLSRLVAIEMAKWGAIIKGAGIQPQ